MEPPSVSAGHVHTVAMGIIVAQPEPVHPPASEGGHAHCQCLCLGVVEPINPPVEFRCRRVRTDGICHRAGRVDICVERIPSCADSAALRLPETVEALLLSASMAGPSVGPVLRP